jgi:hypothetical protein
MPNSNACDSTDRTSPHLRFNFQTAESNTSFAFMSRHSRGARRPGCASNVPLRRKRAQGRPGAHRTHGPRATKSTRQNHRYRRDHPAFPAQWFYGLYVLSPVTMLFCHRHPAGHDLARLSACIGAPRPHDFAVRSNVARHIDIACVHRIPRSTSVTIAIRPLPRRDAKRKTRFAAKKKPIIFRSRTGRYLSN